MSAKTCETSIRFLQVTLYGMHDKLSRLQGMGEGCYQSLPVGSKLLPDVFLNILNTFFWNWNKSIKTSSIPIS